MTDSKRHGIEDIQQDHTSQPMIHINIYHHDCTTRTRGYIQIQDSPTYRRDHTRNRILRTDLIPQLEISFRQTEPGRSWKR